MKPNGNFGIFGFEIVVIFLLDRWGIRYSLSLLLCWVVWCDIRSLIRDCCNFYVIFKLQSPFLPCCLWH